MLHLIATYGYAGLIDDVLHTMPDLFAMQNNHTRYPIHTAILDNQINKQADYLSMLIEP